MANSIEVLGHKIEGVAFDLEGTSVDLEKYHLESHAEASNLVGVSINLGDPDIFERIPHLIGGPDERVMDDVLHLAIEAGTWNSTSDTARNKKIEELVAIKRTIYQQRMHKLTKIPPREGLIDVVSYLTEQGLPIAIGSLTDKTDALTILEKSGLDQLFDPENIIIREHVKRLKPYPDVYILTAQRMGIPRSRQLVFDDSHNGIRAAIEADSLAVGVQTFKQEIIAKRLREAGAIYIARNWTDVKDVLFSKSAAGTRRSRR